MLKGILTFLLIIVLLAIPSIKVKAVNCDITVRLGQSIQSAINRASNNNTICVEYSTYHESIDINKL